MKRFIALMLVFLVVFFSSFLLMSCKNYNEEEKETETGSSATALSFEDNKSTSASSKLIDVGKVGYTALNYNTTRAIWLSQFDMTRIYTDGGDQRSVADYTARAKQVVENIKSLGMNTVIIQLRPNGDSIYPSEIYPTSKYVAGAYGAQTYYDAFAIFLELAHRAELSVHAWVNPLRCMSDTEILSVPLSYEVSRLYAEENGRYIVSVDGYCYLNPAYAEVRELICGGVSEILERYDVDGIHIDDYFYPTTAESFDAEAYSEYTVGGGSLSLADFRREQINTLVRDIYATVKNNNKTVLFGVSPGGNTQRNYNELYADVEKWCSNEGYVDYICPQVYFGFEHASRPFDAVCEEFSGMIKNGNVRLIIGMTLGKAYSAYSGGEDTWAGTGSREWIENKDVLRRSLEYIKSMDNCGGAAFFSYQYFFDVESGESAPQTAQEVAAFLPLLKIE